MDTALFNALHAVTGNPFWDSIFIFFADTLGYGVLLAFALLWGLGAKNRTHNAIFLYCSIATAFIARFVVVSGIRFLYNRPRPFDTLNFVPLLEHSSGHSFPSGHAAFFFALAVSVYVYNKKAGVWFLAAAGLIAFSRVYVGIHFPLDVIVGAGIGISTAAAVYAYSQKSRN